MSEKTFIPFDLARNLRITVTTVFPNVQLEFVNNEQLFKLICSITDRIKIGIVSCIEGCYQSVVQINGQMVIHNDTYTDPWVALKQSIKVGFDVHVETVCNLTSELESFRVE